jgi:hypothetical protein
MNVNSRGHNLDTRFKKQFSKIKRPPGPKNPVGAPSSSNRSEKHYHTPDRPEGPVKRSDLAIGYTVFYGRISTIVPFGANLLISSISSSVTAIHPFVQSTAV